jgi:hypothetical protein
MVVVNYNGAAFVDEFARSLAGIDYPNLHVVVVDNGSQDGSAEVIESARSGAVALRCPENLGTAGGNNAGFRYCLEQGFDYVLVLNNDTVVTADFLAKLVAGADERTVVAPKILYYYDHGIISTHAGDFDWRWGRFRNTFHGKPDGPAASQPRDLQTASFCCALVPTRALREVGLLDERFFMYYEETDWLRQALDRGFRLRYIPEAVIYHRESGSSGGGWMTPFKQYYATRNRLYLIRKHQRSRFWFTLFTVYFLAGRAPYVGMYAARRQGRMLRALLLGVWHYYRGRMGRTLAVEQF